MNLAPFKTLAIAVAFFCPMTGVLAADTCSGGADWVGDLTPIAKTDWNPARAAHLIERAGFGETPEGIAALAQRDPAQLVRDLVAPAGVDNSQLAAFEESGIFDPALDPFPASRPAATDLAKEKGEALGVKVKPAGNRRLQPVVNRFFYWLRASKLETQRLGTWWANRMLTTSRPLEEKMALFWHGHFATSEDKVRDYRKMLKQVQLFQSQGLGDFRELLIGVAKDPAMLAYLDAGPDTFRRQQAAVMGRIDSRPMLPAISRHSLQDHVIKNPLQSGRLWSRRLWGRRVSALIEPLRAALSLAPNDLLRDLAYRRLVLLDGEPQIARLFRKAKPRVRAPCQPSFTTFLSEIFP